jgi:hypothetical protein
VWRTSTVSTLRDALQHGVADRVGPAVVDVLEVVEVGDRDGERAPVADRAVELVAQALVEAPPVREAGQAVLARLPLELDDQPRLLRVRRGELEVERGEARVRLGELVLLRAQQVGLALRRGHLVAHREHLEAPVRRLGHEQALDLAARAKVAHRVGRVAAALVQVGERVVGLDLVAAQLRVLRDVERGLEVHARLDGAAGAVAHATEAQRRVDHAFAVAARRRALERVAQRRLGLVEPSILSSVAPRLLSAPAWPSVAPALWNAASAECSVASDSSRRPRFLRSMPMWLSVRARSSGSPCATAQREALLVPLEADVGPARARMDDADRAHRRRLRGEVARVLGDRERAQVVGERLRRVAQRVVDLPDAAQRVGAADVVADGLEQRERLAVGLERARLVERELGGAALEVAGARPRTGVGHERGELGRLGGEARGVARVVRERVGRLGQQRRRAGRVRTPGPSAARRRHASDTSTRQS